ncbi:unnamed protein product, partial [Symbiodinium sp. KB8]
VMQRPRGAGLAYQPPHGSVGHFFGSSWQESWPAKLSSELTAELRKRFEDDYPTELLDNDSFPSSRLLALTSKMVAEKEIRWLPWKFRLSAKAQDDNLLIRPKKLPRLTELSDLLLDEAQAADKRAWELIGELVNIHSWKLDDALHEVTQDGKGKRAHLRGNGKGHKGKNDSSSHAEDPPPERSTRGGKGKKGPTSSAGKWLSTLFMEGKQHTLCVRYQQGQDDHFILLVEIFRLKN